MNYKSSNLISYLCALLFKEVCFIQINMRNILGILFLSFMAAVSAQAQTTTSSTDEKKVVSKPSRDHVMIQLSHDRWSNVPDSVSMKNTGRGLGLYLMYDFPIKKSHFSFGAGVGVRFSNVYFDKERMILDSRTDRIVFQNVADSSIKGNKFSMTYLEIPLELRFFANKDNRNKGFKFALGAKVGFAGIGGSHYKERVPVSGKFISEVTKTRRFNQSWRLTPTARIGWGNFSVFAEYTMTPIFNNSGSASGSNPDIRPFSAGIVISGL